jgi:hypothetical protein
MRSPIAGLIDESLNALPWLDPPWPGGPKASDKTSDNGSRQHQTGTKAVLTLTSRMVTVGWGAASK